MQTLTFLSRHFVQDSSCRDCGFFDRSLEPARCIVSEDAWIGAAGPYPPQDEAIALIDDDADGKHAKSESLGWVQVKI